MGDAKKEYRLEFTYDYRGFGDLVLYEDETRKDALLCRTGSVGHGGELKNAIPPGDWLILYKSVATEEPGMSVHTPKDGWKIRLYKKEGRERTRYLIHPDGGLGGTLGCIGIQGTNAQGFRCEHDSLLGVQKEIPVEVKKNG